MRKDQKKKINSHNNKKKIKEGKDSTKRLKNQ